MKLFKAYTTGLKETLRMPRLLFLLFGVNLAMAWIVTHVFKKVFVGGLDATLEFSALSKGFHFAILADYLNNNPSIVAAIVATFVIVGIFYWFVNIFLVGGTLRVLNKNTFTMSNFLSGGSYNFRKFSQIAFLMLLVHLLVAVLVYMMLPIADSVFKYETEVGQTRAVIIAVAVHLVLLSFFVIISDYAKIYALFNDTNNPFKAVWQSLKFTFRYFLKTNALFWLIVVSSVVIMYLFYSIHRDIHELKTVGVILVFLLQQLIILIRIFFRIWLFSSEIEVYAGNFLKDERERIEKIRLAEWEEKARQKAQIELEDIEHLPDLEETQENEAEFDADDSNPEDVEDETLDLSEVEDHPNETISNSLNEFSEVSENNIAEWEEKANIKIENELPDIEKLPELNQQENEAELDDNHTDPDDIEDEELDKTEVDDSLEPANFGAPTETEMFGKDDIVDSNLLFEPLSEDEKKKLENDSDEPENNDQSKG